MDIGLAKTFEVLSRTENEASVPVLLAALDSPDPDVQVGALRAILERRSLVGQKEIIRRLDRVDDRWRAVLDENRGRMTQALRNAVLDSEPAMVSNGCQGILWFHEFDLIPTLVNACEDDQNPHADLTAQTLLSLADLLYEELAGRTDYRPRRDPQLVRRNVAVSLEESVKRFPKHHRREPIEAFLLLAGRDNSTLMQILCDPRHPSYLAVIQSLTQSTRVGIMRLILGYLDDVQAPSALVSVMVHRTDRRFLDNLLRKIGREPSAAAKTNLKHVNTVAWIKTGYELFDQLDDAGQHSAVQLAMATSMKQPELFEFIRHAVYRGTAGGRRAAAEALAHFGGNESNQLILQCLEDPDPLVEATALKQMRTRGMPGALATLIERLEHPHPIVQAAAQQSLAEFNFKRFLTAFDTLEPQVRQTTGELVRRVDPQAVPQLIQELRSPSGKRRLRGLAIARTMGLVPQVAEVVEEMLNDNDHLVRVEAVTTLEASPTLSSRRAIRRALHDSSVAVQEAAQAILGRLGFISLDEENGWGMSSPTMEGFDV